MAYTVDAEDVQFTRPRAYYTPPATPVPPAPFDDTLIGKFPWTVVLGDPGSGKSTTLKKLILDYAEHARTDALARFSGIPILVPLRAFARERFTRGEGYSVLDFLYDQAKGILSAPCSQGFFEHYLETGECLVCFDGLDEVSASGQRQEVSSVVEAFIHRFPRNRYLITSRIVGYDQAPLSRRVFPHFAVLPFGSDGIAAYVRKWYGTREKSASVAKERANELLATLGRSDRLRDLAQRPLLLAIMALVHRIEAELPHERVKLYDKCSEALLTTFEAAKRLDRADQEKEFFRYRREILEAVAFWMQAARAEELGREVIVSRPELQAYIAHWLHQDPTFQLPQAEAWQQAKSFLRLVTERAGLLVERGADRFGFVHLTFQEYFAASYIVRNHLYNLDGMWQLLSDHLLEPAWREVILLLLGKLNDFAHIPSMLVERILAVDTDEERILRRHLDLASACLLDNVRLNTDLQNRILDQWIGIVRAPLCDRQLDAALEALGRLRDRPAVSDRLRNICMDADEPADLRLSLLWAYGEKPPSWVIEALAILARQPTISLEERAAALDQLWSLTKGESRVSELAFHLMRGSPDGAGVVAATLRRPETLNRLAAWFNRTQPVLTEEQMLGLVGSEPALAFLFSRLGWKGTGQCLIEYLQSLQLPCAALGRLLRLGFHHGIPDLPREAREGLVNALIEVAHRPQLGFVIADSIHWLLKLEYSPARLFALVLELDVEFAADDWNIRVMTEFFAELVKKGDELARVENLEDGFPSPTQVARLADVGHSTLLISLLQAIYQDYPEIARQLTARVLERGDNPLALNVHTRWLTERRVVTRQSLEEFYKPLLTGLLREMRSYETVQVLARYLADQGVLTNEEIESAFRPLLEQSDSRWAKLEAVWHLCEAGAIDGATGADLCVELASTEQTDMDLKQFAAFRAAQLGAVQEGLGMLREVIAGPHDQKDTKDWAYDHLVRVMAWEKEGPIAPRMHVGSARLDPGAAVMR